LMLLHLCQIATGRSKGIARYGILRSASIGQFGWISEMELPRENENMCSNESHGSNLVNDIGGDKLPLKRPMKALESPIWCFVDVNHGAMRRQGEL
jgi:hypothetical protein